MLLISTPKLSRCRGSWHNKEKSLRLQSPARNAGTERLYKHTIAKRRVASTSWGAHMSGDRHRAAMKSSLGEQQLRQHRTPHTLSTG